MITLQMQIAAEPLEPTYDSHTHITNIARCFPASYLSEIECRMHLHDPVAATHAALARRWARSSRARRLHRVSSVNIRGNRTSNQLWARL